MDTLRHLRFAHLAPLLLTLLAVGGATACILPQPREPAVTAPGVSLEPSCSVRPLDAPAAMLSADASAADVQVAFDEAAPGDVVVLDGLSIEEPLADLPSGEPGQPVVIDATGSTFTGTWELGGVHDLVVIGARFLSDGAAPWLRADGGMDGVTFEGNAFDITCVFCGDHFTGADLSESDDVMFCGNRFGWWMGDMLTFVPAGAVAFIGNDFTAAGADHGVIVYTGRELVVRGNVFRNPFDRVIHVASSEPDVLSGRALIEHNVFFDSDWDRERDRPGAAADIANDGGGANEVVRLIGEGHVFRDNLLLSNRRGADGECHAALTMSTWEHPPYNNERNEHAKIYGNVFLDNHTHAVSVADGIDTDGNVDNVVAFNVFSGQERGAVAMCSDAISEDDVSFFGNVTHDDTVTLADGDARSLAQLEADLPDWFADNDPSAPAFADPGEVARARTAADEGALTFDERDALFAAFAAPAAEGASPLASLTADADGDTLSVGDAFWFSSGHGLVDGDVVLVDGQMTRVVSVPDRFTLVLEDDVSAAAGATIHLPAMNRAAGVFAP